MPPLQLPPDVPGGLLWYALWVSVCGILIYLFRQLGDPHEHLRQRAEEKTDWQLQQFNTHLWQLVNKPAEDPYRGPLYSGSDLVLLYERLQQAGAAIFKHRRLRRHASRGIIACGIAFLAAIACGGLYLAKYPTIEWASFVGILGAGLCALWSLWHFLHVLVYNLQLTGSDNG